MDAGGEAEPRGLALWGSLIAILIVVFAILLTTFLPKTRLEDKPMASYAEPPEDR